MSVDDLRSLINAERELARLLVHVPFIGDLRSLSLNYYLQIGTKVRRVVGSEPRRLKLIPARLLLALMVLCAKHSDLSEHGFWHCFLNVIGLPNDQYSQAGCRARFREARDLLQHLHFPEGGYSCVTPVLYHAIIPLNCIPDMAALLRKLDDEVGWDAIAEMEVDQLASHLPLAVSRAHARTAIYRFVNDVQSRGIAAQLVRDLCEAGYLHKTGEFLTSEIEALLEDHPIQQEIWRELVTTQDSLTGTSQLFSIFAPPRWQWDIKARELRISIPTQRVRGSSRPATLSFKGQSLPISATLIRDAWEVHPTYISSALIDWSATSRLRVELLDEKGNRLRNWYVEPLCERAVFFRPNAIDTLGVYVESEKGLSPGDWIVLTRQGLRIRDTNGDIAPTRRWHSPRGFEDFNALSINLHPPLQIVNDQNEVLETVPLARDVRNSIHLNGDLLAEADDPNGIPVFVNEPPEITVAIEHYENKKGLEIQWRVLSDVQGPKASNFTIQKLLDSGIAEWSEDSLKVPLKILLPENATGRFRIRLLYGIQSAGYEPAEFFIVPPTQCSPTQTELEKTLFTTEAMPSLEIASIEASGLTCETGTVGISPAGRYIVSWPYEETEFRATLSFQHFSVPLRWYPHVLRVGLSAPYALPLWTKKSIVLPEAALTFSQKLHVEALPSAEYEIEVNGVKKHSGQFDSDGRVEMSLAMFREIVRSHSTDEFSLSMKVFAPDGRYRLPLLTVLKMGADGNSEMAGAVIGKIPTGQSVIHPDYGLGTLETFVEKLISDLAVQTARFRFQRYEQVQFFIPTARRIPLYWR